MVILTGKEVFPCTKPYSRPHRNIRRSPQALAPQGRRRCSVCRPQAGRCCTPPCKKTLGAERLLAALATQAGGRPQAVCVPAEALLQYTVPRAEFIQNTLTLKPGMVYNREALVARLFAAGYVRRSQVDGPGQFSVRGDIVDIYAPDMRQPARVEYWDDEIDSMSSFDLLTQRRDSALEKIYLSPAREVLFGSTAETAEALRNAIKKARGKRRTALEKATEADLSQLDSGLMPEAMDKYYGIRYPAPATLLDHLDAPLFILDEVGGIRDAQKATEFRRSEELTGLLEEGVLCPGLDVLYQTMDDLVIAAQNHSTLLCENFLRGMNEFKLKDLINAEAFAAPNWNGDLASLREDLDPLIAQGYAVTLFAGTPKGAAALTRDLADKGYAVSMSRDVRPAKGILQVLPGHLTAGCTFPFAHAAVLSSRRHGLDEEAAAEAKKRKKNKNALSSLSDIKPGDYVVHQSHGIGMYAGIQRLEVQGATKDYLKVQYSGSDVLYVPVTQLDLLSRYTAVRPRATPSRRTATGSGTSRPALITTRPTTSCTPPPRSSRTWKRATPWIGCSAAMWAWARPKWRCAPPSSASWAASSAPCWRPPPCWRGSIITPCSPAWRLSR